MRTRASPAGRSPPSSLGGSGSSAGWPSTSRRCATRRSTGAPCPAPRQAAWAPRSRCRTGTGSNEGAGGEVLDRVQGQRCWTRHELHHAHARLLPPLHCGPHCREATTRRPQLTSPHCPAPAPAMRRGQIRFLRKGPQRCQVKLTISYEVPSAMAPFASVRGVGRSRGGRPWCLMLAAGVCLASAP